MELALRGEENGAFVVQQDCIHVENTEENFAVASLSSGLVTPDGTADLVVKVEGLQDFEHPVLSLGQKQ